MSDHEHRVASWTRQQADAAFKRQRDLEEAVQAAQANVHRTDADLAQHDERLRELHRRIANLSDVDPLPRPDGIVPIDLDNLD